MSRRTKEHHQPEKIQTQSNPAVENFLIYLAIIVLAGVPFIYGKYFELNFPDPYDSGAYVYSAYHILHGAKLGVEECPSAQTGTLLVNMLGVWISGFNETGPKLVQALLQFAALLLMFVSCKRIFGKFAASVAVIVASLYLSAPLIAKFGNVKEQHMIAFMVIGISCLVIRHSGGSWYWSILSGAALLWGTLFKQTGFSAPIAAAIFIIAQPIFKNRTWKQTGIDIALMLLGAFLSVAPIYIWMLVQKIDYAQWPFYFLFSAFVQQKGSLGGTYVANARKLIAFGEQADRVLRYYGLLILPIGLAIGSVVLRLARIITSKISQNTNIEKKSYEKFVLLFGIWWILDMAFVWISPRSYEQYFLPLNASAAMLGAYIFALYSDRFRASDNKIKWAVLGFGGIILMFVMSQHIIFGIRHSPHSGQDYGQLSRGYVQKCEEIKNRRSGDWQGPWESLAEYIKGNSVSSDTIYVWGWYPGIYVRAQRFSASQYAFTSEMHVVSPQELAEIVKDLIDSFEKKRPKFLVDTYKRDFPWNRPPLELWPQIQGKFLPNDPQVVQVYESRYSTMLAEQIDQSEADRFKAMKPFRDYVMNNYKIVKKFDEHVLFELKNK